MMDLKSSIICSFLFLPLLSHAQRIKTDDPVVPLNYPDLISHADLVYHHPVNRSEAGMPVGNGSMGSLVWTTPSAIHFQINRVDIFGNNSASNNFYQRNTDYCGGAGFVDVDFGEGVFTDQCRLVKEYAL